jgi:hypothetical protein
MKMHPSFVSLGRSRLVIYLVPEGDGRMKTRPADGHYALSEPIHRCGRGAAFGLRQFHFCTERLQDVRRLFLQLCHSWVVSRSRARSAARPCTKSCGFDVSEPIPFPGRDSIFSGRCGAISGRLRFAGSDETPRFKRSTIGSAISEARRREQM